MSQDGQIEKAKPARLYDFIGWGAFVLVLVGSAVYVSVVAARHLLFAREMQTGELPVRMQVAVAIAELVRYRWYWIIPIIALLAGLPVWLLRGRAWILHAAGAFSVIVLTSMALSFVGQAGRDLRLQFTGKSSGPCGPDVDEFMPSAIAGLQSPAPKVRAKAASLLAIVYRERAKEAIPQVTSMLKDNDGRVRAEAAFALWRITNDGTAALPALLACLKSDDEETVYYAVCCLAELGPAAREALPALRELAAKRKSREEDLGRSQLREEPPIGTAIDWIEHGRGF